METKKNVTKRWVFQLFKKSNFEYFGKRIFLAIICFSLLSIFASASGIQETTDAEIDWILKKPKFSIQLELKQKM